MRAEAVQRIEATVPDDAVVLDVGAWGRPFRRADWVLDWSPYETRGLYGFDGSGEERFTRETWIQRDICAREPFPFGDDEIDFVVCSQTLEDIRDPVWVCSEMTRVGKAGYLETPSRYEEQASGIQGPWTGWGHHHWLVDIEGDRVDFLYKHNRVHGLDSDRFPHEFWAQLPEAERFVSLWWEGGFDYREVVYTDFDALHADLAGFVRDGLEKHGWPGPVAGVAPRVRRALHHLKAAAIALGPSPPGRP